MGNGTGTLNSSTERKDNKPRVVLESPHGSTMDARTPRVSFANAKKSSGCTFKARPQMTDVGTIHADVYQNNRVRFQRTNGSVQGSSSNVNNSYTSIRSTGSVPADGNWEPTLNPYRGESEYISSRYRIDDFTSRNISNYSNYSGFSERDYQYGLRQDNGLARVDEI